jgi:carboxypeptidase Taq
VDHLAAYQSLLSEIDKLNSAVALLQWDQRTQIPERGHPWRAEVLGKLSKMAFELATSDRLGELLEALEGREDLTEYQRASVRVVGRDYRRHKAIPADLFERFTIARVNSESAWEKARAASDFGAFAPYLQTMFDYARQFADLFGYKESPYDALLQEYEPGMTAAKLAAIIEPLKADLVPFLRRLMEEGTAPETDFLQGTFSVGAQRELADKALRFIGYDFDAGRIDDTTHPFTIEIGPGDVRVTNRYHEDLVLSGLFSALHEGGHAMYGQGIPDALRPLGLADGASYGIHESQSRLWENMVGRSPAFWRAFRPTVIDLLPTLRDQTAEALCAACNLVSPSLIRVEADEVTYNLHIMLRFELETAVLKDEISVNDLPAAWRDAMKRYLGIEPTTDAYGVLQDVHWSAGMIGYFPSYMLGNLYAAQLYAAARRDLPGLEARIEQGETMPLLDWMRHAVHQHGRIHDPEALIERVTGEPPRSTHFIDYVTQKYSDVYGL